jgi:hypothetical protein
MATRRREEGGVNTSAMTSSSGRVTDSPQPSTSTSSPPQGRQADLVNGIWYTGQKSVVLRRFLDETNFLLEPIMHLEEEYSRLSDELKTIRKTYYCEKVTVKSANFKKFIETAWEFYKLENCKKQFWRKIEDLKFR